MKVSDLLINEEFKLLAGKNGINNEIIDIYTGDLLSWVMSHAKKQNAWLTVQSHLNIIAVAHLLELSCIILVEDAPIDEETLKKADEENIPIIHTSKKAIDIFKLYI